MSRFSSLHQILHNGATPRDGAVSSRRSLLSDVAPTSDGRATKNDPFRDSGNSGSVAETQPDQLRPFNKASPKEQLRRAREVLIAARRLYRARFGPLWDCIREAGRGTIEGYYAERLMRCFAGGPLPQWEENPLVMRAEVYRAVDRAIRRSSPRAGGWLVSASRTVQRVSMPPRPAEAAKRGGQ